MDINIGQQSDLVTNQFPEQRKDCDTGRRHALKIEGKTLVRVNETNGIANDQKLGIDFIEVTKLPDGTIQGYVQISMVIGDYNTNAFGLCILCIFRSNLSTPFRGNVTNPFRMKLYTPD